MPGNVEPRFSQWLAFSGTSVTLDGGQRCLDSHLPYPRACLHAIGYLSKLGFSREQACIIPGAVPIEGRLSGVVDIPNSCSTVYIPTAVFDFDVRPSAAGPIKSTQASECLRPATDEAAILRSGTGRSRSAGGEERTGAGALKAGGMQGVGSAAGYAVLCSASW